MQGLFRRAFAWLKRHAGMLRITPYDGSEVERALQQREECIRQRNIEADLMRKAASKTSAALQEHEKE